MFVFVTKFSSVVGSNPHDPNQNLLNWRVFFQLIAIIIWQTMMFNCIIENWGDKLEVCRGLMSYAILAQVNVLKRSLFEIQN